MFSKLFGSDTASNTPKISEEELQDLRGKIAAISRSQAEIEFNLEGKILHANENFLNTLGYTLDEIRGQHHSLFIAPEEKNSPSYQAFWRKLSQGQFDAGQYRRIAKGGREVWIQASYNPVMDAQGRPVKVVKFATDITAQKQRDADMSGQIAAIHKTQAVIEFSLAGTILDANENFCQALGYALNEIKGQHHRMFLSTEAHQSPDYQAFWAKLARGDFDTGRYERIAKGGRIIWIQASYNPILDANGRPYKVVKFATDVTEQVLASQALESAVAETGMVIQAAQAGDLTQRVDLQGKSSQLAQLCTGINQMLDTMSEVISGIRVSADTVSVAAREISQGNSDLSARTEEQASNVEETASTMEELTSTVKQNTENAARANELAHGAQKIAEKGGQVVAEVVTTMSGIQQSSNRISDIIGVIDGIAFQTNILALNAAVEAARAGEQGRGFAVVATEVRNLAQRSAAAAKEIKGLISDSSDKVDAGSRLVNQAGKTMQEVVSSIQRVAGLVGDITSASREQAAGIEQVGNAISQMDETTQQNAALVEEAAAAAESLEEQAATLVSMVSRFVVDSHAAAAPARASLPPPVQTPRPVERPALTAQNYAPEKSAVSTLDDEWSEF